MAAFFLIGLGRREAGGLPAEHTHREVPQAPSRNSEKLNPRRAMRRIRGRAMPLGLSFLLHPPARCAACDMDDLLWQSVLVMLRIANFQIGWRTVGRRVASKIWDRMRVQEDESRSGGDFPAAAAGKGETI